MLRSHPPAFRRGAAFVLAFICVASLLAFQPAACATERQRLDAGWSFLRDDPAGAEAPDFDVRSWRTLDLPHDWSIELAPDHEAPGGGAIGFFPTGVGWYRKTFRAPASWRDEQKRIALEFEGIAGVTDVWINGAWLGAHPYAFTPFRFDLTQRLRFDADNVIAVRVDSSHQPSARWYVGSGIYRHAWLEVSGPVSVAEPGGVFVSTTRLDEKSAALHVATTLRNDTESAATVSIESAILDPSGKQVAVARSGGVEVAPNASRDFSSDIELTTPRAWTPESPALYRVRTRVRAGSSVIDETETPFGIRTIHVSTERGFELNGRAIKLVGGAVHHDHGPLGAASFDRAEERRVELLRAAGFNAVRTSHNPPAPAFLDACDRLGLLVIDEAFDGWAAGKTPADYHSYFSAWWQRDLDAMVLRDRNHPSVVMWSIGNEMYERTKPSGAQLAQELSARVRSLDATRPVTAGVNGAGKSGQWSQLDPIFDALDAAGYNYELARVADDHARLPQRVIYASESYQSEAFAAWSAAQDFPFFLGDFTWSAWDYLGEAGIGRVFAPGETLRRHWEGDHFPWHGAYCGDIDITGSRKPISHYRAILWNRGGEKLYAAVVEPTKTGEPWQLTPWSVEPALPSWTWPGSEGHTLHVDVFSRHDAVRLELNGKSLGEKPTTRAEEFRARFDVPYAPGVLEAKGIDGGRVTETFALETAGSPARLRLTIDRNRLRADGEDLAFVTVEILDARGELVPRSDTSVQLTINGPATLAAFGNADMTSLETYRANPHRVFQGRAVAILRTTHTAGRVTVSATSSGLASSPVVFNTSNAR
jgi:beta-galactosidase